MIMISEFKLVLEFFVVEGSGYDLPQFQTSLSFLALENKISKGYYILFVSLQQALRLEYVTFLFSINYDLSPLKA